MRIFEDSIAKVYFPDIRVFKKDFNAITVENKDSVEADRIEVVATAYQSDGQTRTFRIETLANMATLDLSNYILSLPAGVNIDSVDVVVRLFKSGSGFSDTQVYHEQNYNLVNFKVSGGYSLPNRDHFSETSVYMPRQEVYEAATGLNSSRVVEFGSPGVVTIDNKKYQPNSTIELGMDGSSDCTKEVHVDILSNYTSWQTEKTSWSYGVDNIWMSHVFVENLESFKQLEELVNYHLKDVIGPETGIAWQLFDEHIQEDGTPVDNDDFSLFPENKLMLGFVLEAMDNPANTWRIAMLTYINSNYFFAINVAPEYDLFVNTDILSYDMNYAGDKIGHSATIRDTLYYNPDKPTVDFMSYVSDARTHNETYFNRLYLFGINTQRGRDVSFSKRLGLTLYDYDLTYRSLYDYTCRPARGLFVNFDMGLHTIKIGTMSALYVPAFKRKLNELEGLRTSLQNQLDAAITAENTFLANSLRRQLLDTDTPYYEEQEFADVISIVCTVGDVYATLHTRAGGIWPIYIPMCYESPTSQARIMSAMSWEDRPFCVIHLLWSFLNMDMANAIDLRGVSSSDIDRLQSISINSRKNTDNTITSPPELYGASFASIGFTNIYADVLSGIYNIDLDLLLFPAIQQDGSIVWYSQRVSALSAGGNRAVFSIVFSGNSSEYLRDIVFGNYISTENFVLTNNDGIYIPAISPISSIRITTVFKLYGNLVSAYYFPYNCTMGAMKKNDGGCGNVFWNWMMAPSKITARRYQDESVELIPEIVYFNPFNVGRTVSCDNTPILQQSSQFFSLTYDNVANFPQHYGITYFSDRRLENSLHDLYFNIKSDEAYTMLSNRLVYTQDPTIDYDSDAVCIGSPCVQLEQNFSTDFLSGNASSYNIILNDECNNNSILWLNYENMDGYSRWLPLEVKKRTYANTMGDYRFVQPTYSGVNAYPLQAPLEFSEKITCFIANVPKTLYIEDVLNSPYLTAYNAFGTKKFDCVIEENEFVRDEDEDFQDFVITLIKKK